MELKFHNCAAFSETLIHLQSFFVKTPASIKQLEQRYKQA